MHKTEIQKNENEYEMNVKILLIMQRRSTRQYNHFVTSLRETFCEYVADELDSDGGKPL